MAYRITAQELVKRYGIPLSAARWFLLSHRQGFSSQAELEKALRPLLSRTRKQSNQLATTSQQSTSTAATSPTSTTMPAVPAVNPIIAALIASQQLAERGAERAYQQGIQSVLSQLRHRGLETSGLTEGALANLAGQFASQLADIRTQTARNLAEMQLRVLENLMQLVAGREAAALQAVAAKAKAAQPLLQTAQSQMQNIISALTGITALSPLTTIMSATPALPPLSVNPDAWLNRPLV